MKNIHVLPTDKPSRLFEDDLQLYYSKDKNRIGSIVSNHHIYITSDEEIKVGDWCFYVNSIYKVLRISSNNRPIIKMYDGTFEISYYRKIILTTDQDLIKDGVQAIDNEFIEWFVKNPSCEEVETVFNNRGITIFKTFGEYKIIIPKEEPKQETQGYICPQTKKQCDDECCVSAEDCHIEASFGIISDCEPSKHETFEEVVKPLMKWLCENTHPHTTIIVRSNSAELVEGIKVIETNEFLID